MGISKITRSFQVTIPPDVRAKKGLKVGDKVLFMIHDHTIELEKMDDRIIEKAAGLWKDLKETGPEYTRRLRKGWQTRAMT